MPDNAPSQPSTPRRGRPRNEVLHGHILWTAAQLFAHKGVARTSTREVAAEAGTTERTLFKHFGSKEGLVQAVMDEAVLPHLAPVSLAGLQAAIERCDGDLRAWHAALLRERLAALAEAPELVRLLLVEMLRDAAVLERFATAWRPAVWEPLVALFAQWQQSGRLRADLPAAALARQFLSLNLGFLIGRVVLAPELAWNDADEMAAVASLFAAGAAGRS